MVGHRFDILRGAEEALDLLRALYAAAPEVGLNWSLATRDDGTFMVICTMAGRAPLEFTLGEAETYAGTLMHAARIICARPPEPDNWLHSGVLTYVAEGLRDHVELARSALLHMPSDMPGSASVQH